MDDLPFDQVYPNYPRVWCPIKILPEEWEHIQATGKARSLSKRRAGWRNKQDDGASLQSDIHGYAGEFAISIWFDLPPPDLISNDLTLLRSGDFGGLEVKTAMSNQPNRMNLIVNEDQLYMDRNYALCYTAWLPEWVVFAGWASGSEIRAHAGMGSHIAKGHPFYKYPKELIHDPLTLPRPKIYKENTKPKQDVAWSEPPQGFFEAFK